MLKKDERVPGEANLVGALHLLSGGGRPYWSSPCHIQALIRRRRGFYLELALIVLELPKRVL